MGGEGAGAGAGGGEERGLLTWDDISSIHGIFIFNEAEAIHKLDLGDLASTMGGEVTLDIGLGGLGGSQRYGPEHQ